MPKLKYHSRPDKIHCHRCNEEKPFTLEFFPAIKRGVYGLIYTCRTCTSIKNSADLKNNRQRANATSRLWGLNNKLSGKCERCSSLLMPNSSLYCEKHWFQGISHNALGSRTGWRYLKDLIAEQHYRCYYTGILLVPGKNASIDHTKSIKLHPELRYDQSNIKWVDLVVNRMKRETDEKDFIDMCQRVVDTQRVQRPL